MKENQNIIKSFSMVTQFTIHILVPVCICSYIGYQLDEKFGTSFWFIILFFAGALAGGRNVYILAQKIADGKDKMPSRLYASNQRKKKQKESVNEKKYK